jgi:hypothetical protein
VTPKISPLRQDDTHRLIPSRHSDESVLHRLAEDEKQLEELFELDGATNDRLLGEANPLPGISVHELLFGVAYAHIVNAAFTHDPRRCTLFGLPQPRQLRELAATREGTGGIGLARPCLSERTASKQHLPSVLPAGPGHKRSPGSHCDAWLRRPGPAARRHPLTSCK